MNLFKLLLPFAWLVFIIAMVPAFIILFVLETIELLMGASDE